MDIECVEISNHGSGDILPVVLAVVIRVFVQAGHLWSYQVRPVHVSCVKTRANNSRPKEGCVRVQRQHQRRHCPKIASFE